MIYLFILTECRVFSKVGTTDVVMEDPSNLVMEELYPIPMEIDFDARFIHSTPQNDLEPMDIEFFAMVPMDVDFSGMAPMDIDFIGMEPMDVDASQVVPSANVLQVPMC